MLNRNLNTILFGILIVAVVYAFMSGALTPKYDEIPLPYSSFVKEVHAHTIKRVMIEDNKIIKGESKEGEPFIVYTPADPQLINDLLNNGIEVRVAEPPKRSLLLEIFINWFPMMVLIGVWIYFMRKQPGSSGTSLMGKSKHKLLSESGPSITFEDVAGCDEAKHDVKEIVDFLKDPKKFSKLGGRIPRGVLLVGPPGTGKTLLEIGRAHV